MSNGYVIMGSKSNLHAVDDQKTMKVVVVVICQIRIVKYNDNTTFYLKKMKERERASSKVSLKLLSHTLFNSKFSRGLFFLTQKYKT